MFLGSERHRSVFRARPINHPDVLVCFSDTMNVQKAWRDQRASALSRGWGPFPEQLDLQPAFFFGFAQRSLFRIFIQFDMAAERQPFIQLPMMNQEDFAIPDHENANGEINLLVNVRHN